MPSYTAFTVNRIAYEKELVIFKDWGMFSSAGNRSYQKRAATLVKKLEKNNGDYKKNHDSFLAYFKAYERSTRTKTLGEGGDTAVRETVWHFACEAARCFNFSTDVLDCIWEARH